MTPEQKTKWLEALRSGEFKQCRDELKITNQYGTYYCCLGVAREILGVARDGKFLSSAFLNKCIQKHLVTMNDRGRVPFPKIADYIEAEVPCQD